MTVLVTGAGRYLGAHTAATLAASDTVHAVDVVPPTPELAAVLAAAGVEFSTVDPSDGHALGALLDEHSVRTVVHMAIAAMPFREGGRAAMKELNVIGTLQLLGACQRSGTVRKVVVRSSSAAYGASSRDPAIFTEDTELRAVPRGGFVKDILDIEGYVRGFRRRRPDAVATVLRFSPFLGPAADTALARYFSQALVPTVAGFDPRLQFVHVDDALEVLRRAVSEDHPGVYNVAGPGVLVLSQAIRRAGRTAVPVPGLAIPVFAKAFANLSIDQLEYLMHGKVLDVARLISEFGFRPRSTPETFKEFVSAVGSHE
ncbi:NAD-dependent epimerase/dehydratase family protein [Longispora albida]|uniref:NAD-dependent epimerase/dehydratase family protein n=1 Tax=Longispora albida TaxID=203523 RepID=UPI000372C8EA|nr:NAD-dependent epimerase/dehydratase family protein [Longispora albida]